MAEEGSSSGIRMLSNISNNYKKLIKEFNWSRSEWKNRYLLVLDNKIIELFTDYTHCKLCSKFIVLTARNACCSTCFVGWMTDCEIDDGSIIECRVCDRPMNTVLVGSDLHIICELLEIDENKREGVTRHFGYPLLDSREMDLLFEHHESDSESNIAE